MKIVGRALGALALVFVFAVGAAVAIGFRRRYPEPPHEENP